MPSVEAALHDFFKAITNIFSAVFNSVFAVFQAILALGQEVFGSVIHLFNAIVRLAVDLTQETVGFVFGTHRLLSESRSIIDVDGVRSQLLPPPDRRWRAVLV